MARSKFSHSEEIVRERVDHNGSDRARGGIHQDGGEQKRLIWWSATYIFLGLLALIMFLAWAMRQHGGFQWKDLHFLTGAVNYHGLFMIVTFMTLNGIADILYRMCRTNPRTSVKIAHATIQIFGFCTLVVALCSIFWWHDTKRYANLLSAHSWIGLIIVLLYSMQMAVGFFGLLVPGFRAPLRQRYLPYHKFTGRTIFLLAMANILIGINKVSAGSTLLNCLALVVILFAINGGYILGRDEYAQGAGTELAYDEQGHASQPRSRHSGGNMGEPGDNMYINISGTQGTGHYQAMADDPAIKEAMAVGRDTFSKFHDRLERKKQLDDDLVKTTTVVTEQS